MKHKFCYRKTEVNFYRGFFLLPSIFLSFMAAYFSAKDSTYLLPLFFFLVIISNIVFWQYSKSFFKRHFLLFTKGESAKAKIKQFVISTGSQKYPVLLEYEFSVKGKTYNFTQLIRSMHDTATYMATCQNSDITVYYKVDKPEEHLVETERQYLLYNDVEHKIKDAYYDYERLVTSSRTDFKSFVKYKGFYNRMFAAGFFLIVGIGFVSSLVYLYFYGHVDNKAALLGAIIFLFIVIFCTYLANYFILKKEFVSIKESYRLLKTGKFAKAKLTVSAFGKLNAVVNGFSRATIAYEFTVNDTKYTRRAEAVNYRDILLLLKPGDEITIAYDPDKPEQNHWVSE